MPSLSLIQLPLEILEGILKNLTTADLRRVMLTCKMLKDLILKNNIVWKTVCRNRMIIHSSSLGNPNTSYNHTSYNQYRISNNWCCGVYRSKIIIQHHTNYIPWLMYYNSEAILVSVGSELQCFPTDRKGHPICKSALWKLDVPKIKRNDVRTNDISRFIVKDNIMVCGNRDGCAAIFSLEGINEKPRILYHIENCHENGHVEVSAVEVMTDSENLCAFTGSIYSSNLRLWYFNVNEYKKGVQDIKVSDEVGIRCMSLNCNKESLAFGLNCNNKPLLLDINTIKFLIAADPTMNARQTIRDIKWHDQNTIILVTHSGKMQLIDVRTNEVVYDVMDPFQSTLYCVKSDNDRSVVVGTSEYSRCVLFDTRNQSSHVQMYFTQKKTSPIYSLDFDSTKLIAAADRSVATLNFNINTSSSIRRDYSQKFELINDR